MDEVICRGSSHVIRTVYGFRRSCFSRRRFARCWTTFPVSWSAFLMSGLSLRRRRTKSWRCGGAWILQPARNLPAVHSRLLLCMGCISLPPWNWLHCLALAVLRQGRLPFCFGERAPILDANVRRVLTRLLGFGEDLAIAAHERTLWELATSLLPHQKLAQAMPRYTQGLMDLGAMVCLPASPCGAMPFAGEVLCAGARRTGSIPPVRTRKLVRSSEAWWLLVLRDSQDRVWLQRRESRGIWAGYCVPVFHCYQDLVEHPLGRIASNRMERASFLHVLTHRDLHLHPVLGQAPRLSSCPMTRGVVWCSGVAPVGTASARAQIAR